ncbi:MAG: phage terminase large subunit [Xanthobacteraceae bacterium]
MTSTVNQRDLLDAIMRRDFYSFTRGIFPIVSTSGAFAANWHLEAIAYALERVRLGETKRLIITLPPRSLKSIMASIAFPAFLLGHDPTMRIICVSYSDGLSKAHANDFRAVFRSELFQRLFPSTRISPAKDTELEVKTTARGFRLATSVGGTLTGRGGNLLIIDDPQKPQDAHSQTAREHVEQWFHNTLYPRLDSKADDAIVVVMQRLHEDDLVGTLLREGGWEHLNLPAIAFMDEIIPLGRGRTHVRRADDVLHPEREPLSSLKQTRAGMGSTDFAAQYQQAPVPPGGNMIRWKWFSIYDLLPGANAGDRLVLSWDTALSSRELSSYSACLVTLKQGEAIYLLDVWRGQVEFPELRRKVIAMHHQWRHTVARYSLIIEDKGSGMSLIQDLKSTQQIYPIAIKPEGDKQMRMYANTAKIESGSVHVPRRAPWLDAFRHEILAFPAGRADDQVDALSQALTYLATDPGGTVRTVHVKL